jgi:hypothetical protein
MVRLLNRGKATDGPPQVMSLLDRKPSTCGRAKSRPPIFALRISHQAVDSKAVAIGIRLQVPPEALATWVANR